MAAPLEHTPSVLLVDDRPENLLALEAVLRPLGVTLRSAQSGQQALRALLDEDFALVLLAWSSLPTGAGLVDTDGRLLRANPALVRLTGGKAVVGRDLAALVESEDRASLDAL